MTFSSMITSFHRHLFAVAAAKKREIGYKFLWSRNGNVFMREHEHSPVLKIINEECFDKLVRSTESTNGVSESGVL